MEKQQIREYIRQSAQYITEKERCESAKKIFTEIEQMESFATAHTIAIYVDMRDEVATCEWIERWSKMGRRVLLPRVAGDDMEFYDYHKDGLKLGAFGILEPEGDSPALPSDIDLMILPGMAFCRDGRRIGRGRGFYDRYLSRPTFRAYTIGVGFAHQLTYDIPCEPHDMVLDRVITPCAVSPIPKIISRVIESAWGDADRIGCGVERLIAKGFSWVLLRFKMELTRTPEADEPLSIETWINGCSRVVTSRNFIIRDNKQQVIGEATSQWCMIDLATRRPIDLTISEINYHQYITPREGVISISGKLAPIDPSTHNTESYKHRSTEADIDFNNHVNTFRYIEMMFDMLPHSTLVQRGASAIEIQFVHESYLGEELTILHKRESEATYTTSVTPDSTFEILRPDGSSSVRARFKLDTV